MKKAELVLDPFFWENMVRDLMAHNAAKILPEIIRECGDTIERMSMQERLFFLKLLATADGRLNPIQMVKVKKTLKDTLESSAPDLMPASERAKCLRYFNRVFTQYQKLEEKYAQEKGKKDYDVIDRERFGTILKQARRVGFSDKDIHGFAVSMASMKVFPVRPKGQGDKRLNTSIQWRYPRIFQKKKTR